LIDAIVGNSITSMFKVIKMLLVVFCNNPPTTEEIQALIAILKTSCRDKHLQKVSKQYLKIMINALRGHTPKQGFVPANPNDFIGRLVTL